MGAGAMFVGGHVRPWGNLRDVQRKRRACHAKPHHRGSFAPLRIGVQQKVLDVGNEVGFKKPQVELVAGVGEETLPGVGVSILEKNGLPKTNSRLWYKFI